MAVSVSGQPFFVSHRLLLLTGFGKTELIAVSLSNIYKNLILLSFVVISGREFPLFSKSLILR